MIKIALGAAILFAAVFAARAESDIAGLLKGGGQSSPESPSVADDSARRDSVIVRGTVLAVDPANRLFALQNPTTGKTVIIYADEQVENFEKLSLAKQATIRYAEAAVLALARNGVFRQQKAKSEPEPAAESSSLQSSEGTEDLMRPRISIFGKVSDVDLRNRYITVENEDGWQIEMHVPSRKAIAGLKVGERVLVTYAEAAAISIQPD